MIWKMGFLRNMKFRHVSKTTTLEYTSLKREVVVFCWCVDGQKNCLIKLSRNRLSLRCNMFIQPNNPLFDDLKIRGVVGKIEFGNTFSRGYMVEIHKTS